MSKTPASDPPGDPMDAAGNAAGAGLAHLKRLATDLAEAAAAAKRLAAAAEAADRALGLAGLYWRVTFPIPHVLVPHLTNAPTPATVPPPQPPRQGRCVTGAEKAEAIEKARAWWLEREAALPPGATPPSQRDDERDAALDLPGVPRRIIRDLRPEAWRQNPTRKSAAPKNAATA